MWVSILNEVSKVNQKKFENQKKSGNEAWVEERKGQKNAEVFMNEEVTSTFLKEQQKKRKGGEEEENGEF
uniref:Uncharacterized protein n=1 Tax=Caenorhabditis tropicalis TaxID=1561998 RepID=A0A1I7TZL4_9PELO